MKRKDRGEVCVTMVDASAAVAARAILMSGPLTETTGSEGEESSADVAAKGKPLSAEEYAHVALEKLFASPLFASSVCSPFFFSFSGIEEMVWNSDVFFRHFKEDRI